MIHRFEQGHPTGYYQRAVELFQKGEREEAVFWFYVGQLRYRFHLTVAKGLDPSGDPAVFASLSEMAGRPLNEYAFGDVPKLAATIDRVLAWDAENENGFTVKKGNEAALEEIRGGLKEMKETILREQENIKAQRKANGLEN